MSANASSTDSNVNHPSLATGKGIRHVQRKGVDADATALHSTALRLPKGCTSVDTISRCTCRTSTKELADPESHADHTHDSHHVLFGKITPPQDRQNESLFVDFPSLYTVQPRDAVGNTMLTIIVADTSKSAVPHQTTGEM